MSDYKVFPTWRDRYTARRNSKDFKTFDTFDEAQRWLRDIASRSIDGELRGPALQAAGMIEALTRSEGLSE